MLLLSKGITWQKHCYFQIPYETKVKFWKKIGWLLVLQGFYADFMKTFLKINDFFSGPKTE